MSCFLVRGMRSPFLFPGLEESCDSASKHENDRLCCDYFRWIILFSHCEKVMAKVILQRIKRRTEEILGKAQAEFRSKRSTIDYPTID